jgi:hypothetical protein
MKILRWTLEFLLHGLRFSGLPTYHVPLPLDHDDRTARDRTARDALAGPGRTEVVLLPVGTQSFDGLLSPAEERIWSDLVAGLTGRASSGE